MLELLDPAGGPMAVSGRPLLPILVAAVSNAALTPSNKSRGDAFLNQSPTPLSPHVYSSVVRGAYSAT
jgi:hypothetical protein